MGVYDHGFVTLRAFYGLYVRQATHLINESVYSDGSLVDPMPRYTNRLAKRAFLTTSQVLHHLRDLKAHKHNGVEEEVDARLIKRFSQSERGISREFAITRVIC